MGRGNPLVSSIAVLLLLMLAQGIGLAQVSGAIFTTNSTCAAVNQNIYDAKTDVYLNGGPTHPGAAGLPDGQYCVQVTDPSGSVVLGTSAPNKPITVLNGEFVQCYQLWAIVMNGAEQGFADTPNAGGEYKVWVSKDCTFPNDETKTDNFKVKPEAEKAIIKIIKFYDCNANGRYDPCDGIIVSSVPNGDGKCEEVLLPGWKVHVEDSINSDGYTTGSLENPLTYIVEAEPTLVSEYLPIELNWRPTTKIAYLVKPESGEEVTVWFGNVCLGPGGAYSPCDWSTVRALDFIGPEQRNLINSLHLVDGDGLQFDPPSFYAFRMWIQNSRYTSNKAYALSAELVVMALNVSTKFVKPDALVYAPGTKSANGACFAKICDLIAEADAALADDIDGKVCPSDENFIYFCALTRALCDANWNKNFVQPHPCCYTFFDCIDNNNNHEDSDGQLP